MKNESVKIFAACALGAFIGSLIALSLGTFWWIGFLVGGIIGYITYDLPEVAVALRTAWATMVGWKLDRVWWKERYPGIMRDTGAILTFYLTVFAPLVYPAHSFESGVVALAVLVSLPIVSIGMAILNALTDEPNDIFPDIGPLSFWFWQVPKFFLWTIPLALLPEIPKAWVFCRTKIPIVLISTIKFVRLVFKLIHSDMRLLCASDAAIGALLGYYYSSPIIGAICGGVLGVLNYEVISIRVMKLVPRSASLLH